VVLTKGIPDRKSGYGKLNLPIPGESRATRKLSTRPYDGQSIFLEVRSQGRNGDFFAHVKWVPDC
jgi:hypothetical protein